jgi:uncharacterized integral membrane protein
MDGEQIYRLPIRRTIANSLVFGILCIGLSVGSALITSSMQNEGFRILGYILAILFAIPAIFFIFQIIRIARSRYAINRDGLTIYWGFQTMVIPIQEIEWIRPYDQMGYAVPFPALGKIGILSGHIFYQDLGDILFFATSYENAFLIGTSREVLFLSPMDAQQFQKGIQEAVYSGSITPLERKSIQMESPVNTVRANPALYIPLVVGIFLALLLFVLFGFIVNTHDTMQVGLIFFESTANVVIIPILAVIINGLNAFFAPRMAKNETLKPYGILLAFTGLLTSLFLIITLVLGLFS